MGPMSLKRRASTSKKFPVLYCFDIFGWCGNLVQKEKARYSFFIIDRAKNLKPAGSLFLVAFELGLILKALHMLNEKHG